MDSFGHTQNPVTPAATSMSVEAQSKESFRIVNLFGLPVELMGMIPEDAWNSYSEDQKLQILMDRGLFQYVQKVLEPLPAQEPISVQMPPSQFVQTENLPPQDLQALTPQEALSNNAVPMTTSVEEIALPVKEVNHAQIEAVQSVPTQAEPAVKPEQGNSFSGAINVAEVEKDNLHKKFQEQVAEVRNIEKEALLQPPIERPLSSEEKARINEEIASSANQKTVPKLFGHQPSSFVVQNTKDLKDKEPVTSSRAWIATLLEKLWDMM